MRCSEWVKVAKMVRSGTYCRICPIVGLQEVGIRIRVGHLWELRYLHKLQSVLQFRVSGCVPLAIIPATLITGTNTEAYRTSIATAQQQPMI